MAGLLGFGTTITFSSGFCANTRTNDWSGIHRDAIDITNNSSPNGFMQYVPSKLINPGQVKTTMLFQPDTAPVGVSGSVTTGPLGTAAETITVTFPIPSGKTNGATWACSGFCIDMGETTPYDGLCMADITLQFTGQPTFTASS